MADDITDRLPREAIHDPDREARIDADLKFMEDLEAFEAEEEVGLIELPSLATEDLLAEIAAAKAQEERRADPAAVLRAPDLDYDNLAFLSGLTRAEMKRLMGVWPTVAPDRRRRLVRAMALRAEDDLTLDFTRALLVAARDTEATVRAAAIDALWEADTPDVLATLTTALRDDAPRVRLAATNALAPFAARAAAGELLPGTDDRLRDALLTLARIRGEPVEVVRRAVAALGVFDDADTNALIAATYDRDTIDDRAAALEAMGRSCNSDYLPTLRAESTAREREVRFEATRALGELALGESTPNVEDRLTDPDRAVRFAAVVALGQIGSRAAMTALREHRGDSPDADWQEAVDASLAEASYADNPLFPT